MGVLYRGSYLGSSHSSVSVGTPTHCDDQAILILKVFWFKPPVSFWVYKYTIADMCMVF